jgi:chaperonin cofactor prefoldin
MNSEFKTKPGFVEKRMKQFTDRLEQLKSELKSWEDMIPVNNMGKLARQTKIDNLKSEIQSMNEDTIVNEIK